MLRLYEQSNKEIDKGVKNKVVEIINQEEFQIVQQNIDKFVDKQIQENKNKIKQKSKENKREGKEENGQETINSVIIPEKDCSLL